MRLLVPPPVQALISAGAMYMVASLVPEFSFDFAYKEVLAALFVVPGVLIDLFSIRMFFKNKTTVSPISPAKTSSLVTSGPFKFSRNPMYLGMVLILTGFGVWLGNYAVFLIIPCFVAYLTRFQIVPEEEVMLEKFGMEYADYCARVGRWF